MDLRLIWDTATRKTKIKVNCIFLLGSKTENKDQCSPLWSSCVSLSGVSHSLLFVRSSLWAQPALKGTRLALSSVEEEEIISLIFWVTPVMSGTIQTSGHTLAQFNFKSHDTPSLVVLSTSKRLGHWGINQITDLLTAAALVLEPGLFSASNGHFQGQAQAPVFAKLFRSKGSSGVVMTENDRRGSYSSPASELVPPVRFSADQLQWWPLVGGWVVVGISSWIKMAEHNEAPGSFLHLTGIYSSTGRMLCVVGGRRERGEKKEGEREV